MERAKRVCIAALIVLILLGPALRGGEDAAAQSAGRQTTLTVPFTENEWWLIRWSDNTILCRIVTDHDGLPTSEDVNAYCGTAIHQEWLLTPPCDKASTTNCAGVYLFLLSSQPKTKEVIVELPPAVVWVDLEGCTPMPPENRCNTLPSLRLTGEEPLPNEVITAIHGTIGAVPFSCDGPVCTIPLSPTPLEGMTVEFWADSSFGDTTEHFTAQVRVIDTGVSPTPGGSGWYVDVISSQWRGARLASCAFSWQAFPPPGGPPDWLSTPEQSVLLASGEPYFYLAGRLISQGLVDTRPCSTGGMLPNGYADACGLEQARPLVEQWQNRFDSRIVTVAQETSIPAQLMKNLFAQESQFWPGVFRVPHEFGLGQVTDNGADAILLWNESFFQQFCPLVLAEDACAKGYFRLGPVEQAMLRGAAATQVRSDCPDCSSGIDLQNVDFSVSFFASVLQANCEQVGQLVTTATNQVPGTVSSYEDLWRLTVANYHAGPGCVSYAIHSAWQSTGVVNWDQVSTRFTEACQGVVPYVQKITNLNQ